MQTVAWVAILSERAQQPELALAQAPVRALLEPIQAQRPEAQALQFEHGVPDGLAHPANLTVATLVDRQLDRARPAGELRARGLRHLKARVRQAIRKLAVVRQQDQPAAVGVETPDRIEPA